MTSYARMRTIIYRENKNRPARMLACTQLYRHITCFGREIKKILKAPDNYEVIFFPGHL